MDMISNTQKVLQRQIEALENQAHKETGYARQMTLHQKILRETACHVLASGGITERELDSAAQTVMDIRLLGSGTGLRSLSAKIRDNQYVEAAIVLASVRTEL